MRGRGIDFEHRFNTSRWAEDLLIEALGQQHGLLTVRFGLSEVQPEGQLIYGTTSYKEPDLLVYSLDMLTSDERAKLVAINLEKTDRLNFAVDGDLGFAFAKALAAIEVEFSPYRAAEMKGRYWQPRTQERWEKRPLKRATPPTAPNVIVKEEDLPKLKDWEETTHVPIMVIHLFDQEGFAISLKNIHEFNKRYEATEEGQIQLQVTTGIFKVLQAFNRIDAEGASEKKVIFRVSPSAAIKVGDLKDVKVSAQLGISASKKYVTHAIFSEGRIEVAENFLRFIRQFRR
jgi:hypothetical protein